MELSVRVERFIRERSLLQPNEPLFIAVSGGPDSMALLHMMHRLSSSWGLELIAVHVNHQIRGGEADQEAQQVRQYTKQLGVQFKLISIDIPSILQRSGGNLQEVARKERYAAMLQLAEELQVRNIALAHHADDQVETFLMRLIKGSSPAGLSGMRAIRQVGKAVFIRPLLHIYKHDLLQYCREYSIPYAEDSSNKSTAYLRNRLRLELVPYMQQLNPNVTQAIHQTVQLMQEDEDYIEQQTESWVAAQVTARQGIYYLQRSQFALLSLALQRRVIKLILSYLSEGEPVWDYNKLERFRAAIVSAKTGARYFDFGRNIECAITYDEVRFGTKRPTLDKDFEYVVETMPQQLVLNQAVLEFKVLSAREVDAIRVNTNSSASYYDFDLLALPLTVRNRRPGDRMHPEGMSGSKKVKDLFIDQKVKPEDRSELPLLFDAQGRLLWIPKVRRSRFAHVTGETERILHIIYKENIS